MSKSKLSIILTSHNKWPLLQNAVWSVLSQTYKNFELIVVDDCSDDPAIINFLSALEEEGRIRFIQSKRHTLEFRQRHKMVSLMVNIGLRAAKGEYISYICDDNMYLLERCERMVKILDSGEADLVVNQVRWVAWHGGKMKQQKLGNYVYKKPYEKGHEELIKILEPSGSNFICHDAVMHRRTRLRWPTDNTHTPVDWRFWLKLHRAGFRIRLLNDVGEEAYLPGTWRNGVTVERAIRNRVLQCKLQGGGKKEMKKIQYAKNVTKKVQVLPGGAKTVDPGAKVEAKVVTLPNGCLMPGFAYDDDIVVPSLKEKPTKPGTPPEVDGDLITKPKKTKKKFPFKKKEAGKKKAAKKKAPKKKAAKKSTKKVKTARRKASKKKKVATKRNVNRYRG